MVEGLQENILSPKAMAGRRHELVEAIKGRRAHLHYTYGGNTFRWVVIVPRAPTPLCGTDRCIPLHQEGS